VQGNNHQSAEPSPARLRCAIYTRKSTEEGLEQEFNSPNLRSSPGSRLVFPKSATTGKVPRPKGCIGSCTKKPAAWRRRSMSNFIAMSFVPAWTMSASRAS
jgi:hypothetical protein